MKNRQYLLPSVLSAILIAAPFAYPVVEPAVADAVTDSVAVTLNVAAGISITSPSDSSMSQSLGVSANTAIATTTWNVKTNNSAGYTLAVRASTNPAMQSGGNSISNYTPAVAATPETWSVSSGAEFGFSAYGSRITTGTWGTSGSFCGANNTPSTNLKYRDLASTDITIATHGATTTTAGDDATVCYAVEQNGFYVPSGTYTATVVATAATQ